MARITGAQARDDCRRLIDLLRRRRETIETWVLKQQAGIEFSYVLQLQEAGVRNLPAVK